MTVSTTTNRVIYRGNGSATSFAVPFKIIEESHLVVRRRVFATGLFEHTYIGTEYTYNGLGASSGTLTLSGTALDDDYELVIERIVPFTQELDIVNAGGFYPDTVEEQLDLMVMASQQLDDRSDRALIVPEGELGLTVPREADRIGPDDTGTLFGWDESGDPIAVELIPSSEQGMLTEAQRRISGDAVLNARISQEVTTLEAVDTALDAAVDALDTRIDLLETTVTSGRLAYPTWAALNAVTGTAGQVAEVPLTDAGTHTDPVVGGTVNNSGIFRWSASPAGWERLYDVDAASAQGYATDAEASAVAAAASEAILAANGIVGIENGADATTARPAAGIAVWSTSVDPDNRADGDLLVVREGLAPASLHRPPALGDDLAMRLWADKIDPEFNAPNNKMKDWLDVSGSNNHLWRFSESIKPDYVASHASFLNRPVVNLDGVDDYMVQVQMEEVVQPFTVVIIAKNDAVGGASEHVIFDSLFTTAGYRVRLYTDRAGFVTVWAGTAFIASTAAGSTDLRLYILHMEGASTTLRVNGPLVLSGAGDPGAGKLRDLHLGRDSAGGNRFDGQIALFDIVRRGLTAGERTAYENFFASHYGGVVS